MDNNEFEYLTGQGRTTFPELLRHYAAESEAARRRDRVKLNIAYGPHERQRFDYFPADQDGAVTVVYFHAGYWQSRDKDQFSFIASAFNDAGFGSAMINYPLCPSVTVPELVEAAAAALPAVSEKASGPLLLVGHSAGAHIAVELALRTDDPKPVAGIIGVSGIYDLQPLVDTSLNKALRLDMVSARASSPVHRMRAGLPPAIFAAGGFETKAFVEQTRMQSHLWSEAGNDAACEICEGDDHFSILRSLVDVTHPLNHRLTALIRRL